jgi:hypothetical protein
MPKVASKPSTTGPTLTVACKHPLGFQLRLYKFITVVQPTPAGGYLDERIAQLFGEPVFINGPGREVGTDPKSPIAGGAALTFGVSKDFWDAWMEQNKTHPAVVNGILFAHKSDTRGMAKEREGLKTGLEPLEQNGDPRLPRRFDLKKLDRRTA